MRGPCVDGIDHQDPLDRQWRPAGGIPKAGLAEQTDRLGLPIGLQADSIALFTGLVDPSGEFHQGVTFLWLGAAPTRGHRVGRGEQEHVQA